MGFPDCGSSYFLAMQLDKDFKPQFKLLETRPDSSGDLNHVLRIKKIDIGQMQMLDDEMNLSLVDWEKLCPLVPNAAGPNQTSEHEFLPDIGCESSMQIAGNHLSGFASLVDEVFGLEKGSSAPPLSVQNFSSSLNTSATHYGSAPMNLHNVKGGTSSAKWEGGIHVPQVTNVTRASGVGSNTHYYGSMYSSGTAKGPTQSSSVGSLSTSQGWSTTGKRLSGSKSEQNLASTKSPPSVDTGSCTATDEDQLRALSDSGNDASCGNQSSQLLSPPRSSPNGPPVGPLRAAGSGSCATTPVCKILSVFLSIMWIIRCFFPFLFHQAKYDLLNVSLQPKLWNSQLMIARGMIFYPKMIKDVESEQLQIC